MMNGLGSSRRPTIQMLCNQRISMNIIFGDVLLLNGSGKRSKINKFLQARRRKNEAGYSHVALCLSPNVIVHAMPHKGVHIVTFDSMLEEFSEDWVVIRNKALSERVKDPLIEASYARDALYHLGKKYDLTTILDKNLDDSFVCSNFVAACLKVHKVEIGKSIGDVLPVDFQQCLATDEWMDVTSEHKEFYKYSCNEYAVQQIKDYYQIWANAQSLSKQYDSLLKLDEACKKLDNKLGYKPVEIEKPKHGFWDTDQRK